MQSKLVKLIIVFLLVQVSLMAQSRKVFVLVHGAWHGGWCWQRVSEQLRAEGSIVYTPSLSGLGEHKNQSHDSIDLNTHITDIINLLTMENLHVRQRPAADLHCLHTATAAGAGIVCRQSKTISPMEILRDENRT